MQSAITKTHAQGQAQEGAGQARQVLAHGAAEAAEISLHQLRHDSEDVRLLIHSYK